MSGPGWLPPRAQPGPRRASAQPAQFQEKWGPVLQLELRKAGIAPKEIIAAGEEETLLAPLPLAALRLDAAVIRSLESVGLRTAGAILSAPRAPLVRRFGRGLLMRLDQAVGRLEEAISPRLPVPPLSVERALAEPIVLSEEIESLVGLLAGTLKTDLERRGEGARRLQLALFRVDAAVCRIEIGTSRPLREPRLIKRLFHERLAVLGSEIVPASALSWYGSPRLPSPRSRSSRRICQAGLTMTARRSRCLPTGCVPGSGARRSACRQRSPAICRSCGAAGAVRRSRGASCRGRRRFFVRHRAR